MSKFSKDAFHEAIDASASIHINRFMSEETTRNLRNLRDKLSVEAPTSESHNLIRTVVS